MKLQNWKKKEKQINFNLKTPGKCVGGSLIDSFMAFLLAFRFFFANGFRKVSVIDGRQGWRNFFFQQTKKIFVGA